MRKLYHQGLVYGVTPGRQDTMLLPIQSGSYVVPSDVTSYLGCHNSMAGDKKLQHLFFLEAPLPKEPTITNVIASAGSGSSRPPSCSAAGLVRSKQRRMRWTTGLRNSVGCIGRFWQSYHQLNFAG